MMNGQRNQQEIGVTLSRLGVPAGEIRRVETISVRPGHRLYRIHTRRRSHILKSFPVKNPGNEIKGYGLLRQLGVPTINVIAMTETDLLLEDLTCSKEWRLATELDAGDRHVGRAVARWYWYFHEKGSALAESGSGPPPSLKREEDLLDRASIESAGRALGLSRLDSWRLAAGHIDLLKLILSNFGTTLALSRNSGTGMETMVFDYDLLGIGTRYSDVRNAVGSLSGEAITGFHEVYGSVDPGEMTLDRPLATLYALVSAARMATFPKWAEESRQAVLNGTFKTDLLQAVGLVSDERKRDATIPTANQATINPDYSWNMLIRASNPAFSCGRSPVSLEPLSIRLNRLENRTIEPVINRLTAKGAVTRRQVDFPVRNPHRFAPFHGPDASSVHYPGAQDTRASLCHNPFQSVAP